ncbi:putative neural-cadherin 2 [Schistocerca nitens]|uniref:putative neural-cadherin 2 n=1 Tax=Schistocerca nitens TaxID=7011 RepID=UPI0021191C20|nr:putative neural-cadherin 2 [Schistocerca nitens]
MRDANIVTMYKDAAVRYLIEAGNDEGTFSIDGDTGDVIVAAELDYERRTMYELQLVAVSGKESSRAELLVTVLDANDEPPVFQQAVYRAELQEEEDPAHLPRTILTVRAVDGDVGRPQDIVYSISGPGVAPEGSGDDDFFRVDPNTGEIFVLKPLDRDPPAGRPLWRFTAFAQDEGGAGLVGFADVQVTLSDVNDNPPVFTQPLYHGYVVENAPAGTFILNVTAVDNDDPYEGSNAKLRYSIEKNAVDERTGSPMFEIDPDTGEIMTVVCCLDRERTPRFTIQVVATDGGGQEGTTTVSITVKDVNDTPPEFSKLEWFVEVDETDGDNIPRKPILTVTVRDQDESNTFQFKHYQNEESGPNHVYRLKVDQDIVHMAQKPQAWQWQQSAPLTLAVTAICTISSLPAMAYVYTAVKLGQKLRLEHRQIDGIQQLEDQQGTSCAQDSWVSAHCDPEVILMVPDLLVFHPRSVDMAVVLIHVASNQWGC